MKPRSLLEGYTFEEWLGNGTQISDFRITGGRLNSIFRFSSRIYTINDIQVEEGLRRHRLGNDLAEGEKPNKENATSAVLWYDFR